MASPSLRRSCSVEKKFILKRMGGQRESSLGHPRDWRRRSFEMPSRKIYQWGGRRVIWTTEIRTTEIKKGTRGLTSWVAFSLTLQMCKMSLTNNRGRNPRGHAMILARRQAVSVSKQREGGGNPLFLTAAWGAIPWGKRGCVQWFFCLGKSRKTEWLCHVSCFQGTFSLPPTVLLKLYVF